jgi:predicted nucleic acid-binding protein
MPVTNGDARLGIGVPDLAAAQRTTTAHAHPGLRAVPVVDGLMAATALVQGWTLVTRNVDDVRSIGVGLLNPFTGGSGPDRGNASPHE